MILHVQAGLVCEYCISKDYQSTLENLFFNYNILEWPIDRVIGFMQADMDWRLLYQWTHPLHGTCGGTDSDKEPSDCTASKASLDAKLYFK